MSYNFNRKLQLERAEKTPDGSGGFHEAWVSLGTLWAYIEPRSARQAELQTIPTAKSLYRVIVRSAPFGSSMRPLPGQRLVEGTRIYLIDGVMEADEAGNFLDIWIKEETAK